MQGLSFVQQLIVWAPPVLLAVTLHEVAHGWVALRLGDTTAFSQGRLSLNPLRHVDPIGTVLVPAILLLAGGFIFGWAKPVPVDYRQLRDPRRDMAIVAIAGPAANIVMAVGWAVILKLAAVFQGVLPGTILMPLSYMCLAGVTVNIVLAVLNLLPVPPLDGGRVATGLLPIGPARALARLEPLGLVVLLVLLASGLLGKILGPPVSFLQHLILGVAG
jgi:Zn-dependent protease